MTHDIPDYDWNYAHSLWAYGLEFYQSRLKQLRFDQREGLFLDAGCGTGQWIDALSSLGKEVVGVDIRKTRLEIASIFLNPKRTHLVRASIAALPFKEGVFNNVICYGVIMFTDTCKPLEQINFVSRQGAMLYVCWNAIGWSLRLLVSPRRSMKMKIQALQTILNSWRNSIGTKYFSKGKMTTKLQRTGFKVLATDSEGLLNLIEVRARPLFSKRFLGFDNVLEALAIKQ